MTNNLEYRVYEHKYKLVEEVAKKYNISKLVYYENTTDISAAIEEKEKRVEKGEEKQVGQLHKT